MGDVPWTSPVVPQTARSPGCTSSQGRPGFPMPTSWRWIGGWSWRRPLRGTRNFGERGDGPLTVLAVARRPPGVRIGSSRNHRPQWTVVLFLGSGSGTPACFLPGTWTMSVTDGRTDRTHYGAGGDLRSLSRRVSRAATSSGELGSGAGAAGRGMWGLDHGSQPRSSTTATALVMSPPTMSHRSGERPFNASLGVRSTSKRSRSLNPDGNAATTS